MSFKKIFAVALMKLVDQAFASLKVRNCFSESRIELPAITSAFERATQYRRGLPPRT